jgi:ribonuclease E
MAGPIEVPSSGGGNGSALMPSAAEVVSASASGASITLPMAAPAPMPIDQLKTTLESAGLSLVQTEPRKLQDAQERMAREPLPTRVPRERPVLAPLDPRPLVQVETHKPQ